MNKCNAFLFTFGVILLILPVDSRPSQETECGGIAEFSCISESECPTKSRGTNIHCGFDESFPKICCRSSSKKRRSHRQVPPVWPTSSAAPTTTKKKDPTLIAQQKCVEYAAARYINKTTPSQFAGKPPVTTRVLDCVKSQPLVHGGTAAVLKEFPHMAVIGYNDRSDKIEDANWDCGGSLISERYVLSAAHCVKGGNGDAKWARLGEYILDDPNDKSETKDYKISQRIPHPKYTSSSVYYDIALFKLQTNVKFTAFIRPICLYTASTIPPEIISKAVITGWGVTATGETNSEVLLKATVNIVNDNECKTTYKNDKFLKNGYDSNSMVCAGDKIDGKDTCQGDSGGPLQVPVPDWVCMYNQVGITSYGDFICGRKGVNAIYTKVSYYVSWIQPIVWP